MKIMIAASEISPYAKSGGLGEVLGSLPKSLSKHAKIVRIMPYYRYLQGKEKAQFLFEFQIRMGGKSEACRLYRIKDTVETYFVSHDRFFNRDTMYGYEDDALRFAFFSKAILEVCFYLDFYPDILHLNDWQTALCAYYLKKGFYRNLICFHHVKTVFTIHNLRHQGVFPKHLLPQLDLNWDDFHQNALEFYDQISFMKAGIAFSDSINTVSPSYAKEILQKEFAYGLEGMLQKHQQKLTGILNGIDIELYNPKTDPFIHTKLSNNQITSFKSNNKKSLQQECCLKIEDHIPILALIGRLSEQKGLDMLITCLEELLKEDIQLVLLGSGEERYEHYFHDVSKKNPKQFFASFSYDDAFAHRIYAGSDMFLMPSIFEPCGLGQLYALRYASLPIVRRTGGLNDTVISMDKEPEKAYGFAFDGYDPWHFYHTILYAISCYKNKKVWLNMQIQALQADFSWEQSAKAYEKLYLSLSS